MATASTTRSKRRPRRLRAKPKPQLTVAQILAWADAFHQRLGRWPISKDGRIREAWDDTWRSVDGALRRGRRGLDGGSSLARLLCEHRGVRNRKALAPYTIEGILAWADVHYSLTGQWPNEESGPVSGAAGETWRAIDSALRGGVRGLPGGSSLPRLLAEHRDVRNRADLPRLTTNQILAWADAWHAKTGRWPKSRDGVIPESPGDDWRAIDTCLIQGNRGLKGGQSLARLLAEHRGVRNHMGLLRFTERQILAWADAHHKRTGGWPKLSSGPIAGAPEETWWAVDAALHQGGRGLRGGSSLALLLHRRRGVRHKRLLPRFSVSKIRAWARAYRRCTGRWPTAYAGPIAESPGDTWLAVCMALWKGRRGLRGGSSLARLLKGERQKDPDRR